MIARYCSFLPGTTPDYWEDALTGPMITAFHDEWEARPPAHLLIAAYVGFKARGVEAPPDPQTGLKGGRNYKELLNFFPGGVMRGG